VAMLISAPSTRGSRRIAGSAEAGLSRACEVHESCDAMLSIAIGDLRAVWPSAWYPKQAAMEPHC
jgi:L-aminopeptidase/D-esterase-like protein